MTGWGAMMRAAMAMGVGPEGFWRLSLREWRWLMEPAGPGAPMGRGELERLLKAWPDEERR